jgi:dTDP-4-amino-4,6-dideoxygalactose transaminase
MLRDHGQPKKYYHDIEGYNGRLDALQAGVLSAKLKRLPQWNEERRNHAYGYNDLLAELCGAAITPYEPSWSKAVYHLYVIRVEDRDAVQAFLHAENVATGIHYPIPLHLQKAYAYLGYQNGDFPVSETLSSQILSLPMYPHMTTKQRARVAEALSSALRGKVVGEKAVAAHA